MDSILPSTGNQLWWRRVSGNQKLARGRDRELPLKTQPTATLLQIRLDDSKWLCLRRDALVGNRSSRRKKVASLARTRMELLISGYPPTIPSQSGGGGRYWTDGAQPNIHIRRFTGEMLSDLESLLIHRIKPPGNIQCLQGRTRRPGMTVKCEGDWPQSKLVFRDV